MLANITINAQYNVNGKEYNFKSAINPTKELIMHVINHNRGKGARLSFLLATTFALFGCGGDDSSSGAGSAIYTPPTSSASLSAYDTTYSTAFSETFEVDLSSKVFSSTGGGFTITEVDVLSSDDSCQLESINNTSFAIQASNTKVCDYRYHVMPKTASANQAAMAMSGSQAESSSSAIARVAVSEDPSETTLIPVSAVTLINHEVSVDLKKELKNVGVGLGEGFELEDVHVAYGHSSSVKINASNNQTFDYTPAQGFTGIDRVLYTLIDKDNNQVLMGTVDIAVGYEANQGFTIQEKIEYPDVVHVNTNQDIDISDFVKSDDGDDFQLVYVESFNAIAEPKNPSLGNKIISFKASKPGYHYVSFGVSDYNGTYDMGLIRVEVTDPNQSARWHDVTHGLDLFTAPLTALDAASQGVVYDAKLNDSGFAPAIDMAGFSYPAAISYCDSIGAKVPTTTQLVKMATETNLQTLHHWPVNHNFLAYDDANGDAYQVVLKDNATSAELADGDDYYYVTCVKQGQLYVLSSSDLRAIANGDDEIKVKVQVKEAGEVKPNTWVSATATSGYVTFANSVMTNSEGVAEFNLTSYKAESFDFDISVNSVQTRVRGTFVADSSSPRITSNSNASTVPYSSTDGARVVITLTDDNNNPLKGFFINNSTNSLHHPDTGKTVKPILVQENSKTDVNGKQTLRIKWNESYQIPKEDMTFTIYSEFGNALDSSRVTFEAPPPPKPKICGANNAKGDCIKIVELGGKLFTGTPSVSFLEAINYAGYTSQTHTENGDRGPKGGVFARFKYLEAGELCAEYNNINLQGRNNWRLATSKELESLYNTYSKMFNAQGWATDYYYWSSTPDGRYYYNVNLYDGDVSSSFYLTYPNYVSCVSGY